MDDATTRVALFEFISLFWKRTSSLTDLLPYPVLLHSFDLLRYLEADLFLNLLRLFGSRPLHVLAVHFESRHLLDLLRYLEADLFFDLRGLLKTDLYLLHLFGSRPFLGFVAFFKQTSSWTCSAFWN